jgi:hypothetical protein
MQEMVLMEKADIELDDISQEDETLKKQKLSIIFTVKIVWILESIPSKSG